MTLRVKNLMNRDVVKVHPENTIDYLERVLAEHDISGVPVVDDDGRAIGIVSQTDIVRLIYKQLDRERLGGFYKAPGGYVPVDAMADDLRKKKVSDVMERRIHSVWPDDDIARAAGMMRRLGIRRLLVLDEGRVVGILTTSDLIRVLENVPFFEEYYGLVSK